MFMSKWKKLNKGGENSFFKAFYCFSFFITLNEVIYLKNKEYPLMNQRNIKIYKKWIEKITFSINIVHYFSEKQILLLSSALWEK